MDKDSVLLCDGIVDLEIGVVGFLVSFELCMCGLFCDCFIGVVRVGYLLS